MRVKKKPLLIRVGEACYGDCWKSALARDLRVTDRTMRRWASDGKPPPHRWQLIMNVVGEKNRRLVELIGEIRVEE